MRGGRSFGHFSPPLALVWRDALKGNVRYRFVIDLASLK